MRKHFEILFKDTLLYGLSSAVNKSVWIILVPILARVFSPAEYAVIDVNIAFYTIVSTFLFLGLDSSLVRFYYKFDNAGESRMVTSTILLSEAAILAAACAVIFFFSSEISFLLFKTKDYIRVMKTVILIVPFFILYNFFLNILRCKFERLKFLILSLGASLVQAVLTLFLVLSRKTGIIGIFDAILYSQAVFTVLGFLMTKEEYSFKFSWPLLKDVLGFGIPSLGRSFSQTLIFFADRFFLVTLVPLHMVGLYSMGARIASVINMIILGFILAWSPFALSIQRYADVKQTYSKVLTYYMVAGSTISIVLFLLSSEILRIISPSYNGAEIVIGILAYGYMLTGAYSIICIGVTITGQAVHIAWPSLLGVLINVTAYLILIPVFGILGAALSSLIANVSSLLFLFWITQKYYTVNYETVKLGKLSLICLTAFIAATFINSSFSLGHAFILKMMTFLGYLTFLVAADIVNRKEISRLAAMFKIVGLNAFSGQ